MTNQLFMFQELLLRFFIELVKVSREVNPLLVLLFEVVGRANAFVIVKVETVVLIANDAIVFALVRAANLQAVIDAWFLLAMVAEGQIFDLLKHLLSFSFHINAIVPPQSIVYLFYD